MNLKKLLKFFTLSVLVPYKRAEANACHILLARPIREGFLDSVASCIETN